MEALIAAIVAKTPDIQVPDKKVQGAVYQAISETYRLANSYSVKRNTEFVLEGATLYTAAASEFFTIAKWFVYAIDEKDATRRNWGYYDDIDGADYGDNKKVLPHFSNVIYQDRGF